MVNAKQYEALPKPPAGEYVFEVKRAGIKKGHVWFVLGNGQYELLQMVDLRKGALWGREHCVLAGIIQETGPCGVPQALVGRTVEVRVVIDTDKTGEKEYTNIYDIRGVNHE